MKDLSYRYACILTHMERASLFTQASSIETTRGRCNWDSTAPDPRSRVSPSHPGAGLIAVKNLARSSTPDSYFY